MGTGSNRLTVSVRIAGHEYRIRGEGDEEGLVRIAGYVDRAMERVRARTGTVDSLDVAVLTCLNLAREILAIHEQRTGEADEVRIRSLIDRVEAVLDRGVAETRFRPAGNHSSVPSEGNSSPVRSIYRASKTSTTADPRAYRSTDRLATRCHLARLPPLGVATASDSSGLVAHSETSCRCPFRTLPCRSADFAGPCLPDLRESAMSAFRRAERCVWS